MSDEVSPSRVVSSVRLGDDDQFEAGLRPRTLDAYIGQERLRENLEVSIAATRQRGEALDHVLLYGPPGLGKTTLAYVIANELGVPIRTTAGPVLEKPGDLAAILTNLKEHEVLFIDEIHRMSPAGLARDHGRKRLFYYICTSYSHRGHTVCANNVPLPMVAADDAILTELSDYVLDSGAQGPLRWCRPSVEAQPAGASR